MCLRSPQVGRSSTSSDSSRSVYCPTPVFAAYGDRRETFRSTTTEGDAMQAVHGSNSVARRTCFEGALHCPTNSEEIVGTSIGLRRVLAATEIVAPTDAVVL